MIGDDAQFQCFSDIVSHDSGLDASATDASSGTYGLVQALPGTRRARVRCLITWRAPAGRGP